MVHRKILIVDDDDFQLQLLSRQLALLGLHDVHSFPSGKEALTLLKEQPVSDQLIFLDLNMPGMDGVEFMRHLAGISYAGALVLVSGEDERILETTERLARGYRLHVLGHLKKPVQSANIKPLLELWCKVAPENSRKATRHYDVEEVRRAIAGGELVNYYQPKVEMASGVLSGVEALVRWRHPDDGMVFPDAFIGIAEENGLIDDLTRVVLVAALEQSRRWSAEGLMLRVAVNISMQNLTRLDFADFVLDQVLRSGVAAESLILEVTESHLMTNVLASLDILTRLRLKRISLSIDDFGTGHSSLAKLREIPFDELKIDQNFVHGASEDNTRSAIFSGSLAIARQLGMKAVAEGVEDRADWDFLSKQDCDLAQGYFIGRPMPAEDLRAWLAGWKLRIPELIPTDPTQAAPQPSAGLYTKAR